MAFSPGLANQHQTHFGFRKTFHFFSYRSVLDNVKTCAEINTVKNIPWISQQNACNRVQTFVLKFLGTILSTNHNKCCDFPQFVAISDQIAGFSNKFAENSQIFAVFLK